MWRAVAPTTAAVIVLAGCSSSPPSSDTRPSVNFGSGASVTPGMPGMSGMPSTGTSPTGTAASSGPAAPVAGNAVAINNFKFEPATLTVPVGGTVTWTNNDEEPHTVVAKDGSFHSPSLDTKGTYSFTFTKAGSFDYICSIHPFMTGTVVVTA
ncbi:MAG: cupredoxin family copper-binding protein [Mycobacteriaceae bacterium]|nr:cupredoxin family copper-binding protein [Mycobacteriaceae bacterium]